MLWFERHGGPKLPPLRAALIWYLLGIPFMVVEASVSGRDWANVLLQSLVIALFFLPQAYFTFRYARRNQGIGKPFLLFLGLSLVTAFVVALILARAPTVHGMML
jgi:positive regulator of sigma E activity